MQCKMAKHTLYVWGQWPDIWSFALFLAHSTSLHKSYFNAVVLYRKNCKVQMTKVWTTTCVVEWNLNMVPQIIIHIVWWLCNYRELSIGRWSYISDIDLKRGLISQYQTSDCATGLISRRQWSLLDNVRRSTLTMSLWQWQSVLQRILMLQVKSHDCKKLPHEGKSVGQDTKIHA